MSEQDKRCDPATGEHYVEPGARLCLCTEIELDAPAKPETEVQMIDVSQRQPEFFGAVRDVRKLVHVVTPTGPVALIRPVAEQLLKQGVVSGTLSGGLHAADAATLKAAVMATSVCDFCAAPGASHTYDVPDFTLPHGVGTSTGGWAACDTCANLVNRGARTALLDRSVATVAFPAFPKFSRAAVAELHARFWQAMEDRAIAAGSAAALADFVEERLPHPAAPELQPRDRRIAAVAKLTGLTPQQVDGLTRAEVSNETVAKLVAWEKSLKQSGKATADAATLAELMTAGDRRPLQPVLPHWQVALDMQFSALATLQKVMSATSVALHYDEPVDLNDQKSVAALVRQSQADALIRDMAFDVDAKDLKRAEAFSFNGETIAAITAATESIPRETPLSAIETPNTGAGWFWFGEPLPVATSPMASPVTHALLWSWANRKGEAAIRFSAYVLPHSGTMKGLMSPSVRWYWPLELSLDGMLEEARVEYRASYGPGGKFHGREHLFGEEGTVAAAQALSLFFVAACMWMRQRILVPSAGHVERHARKRYVREHKLDKPPSVQVIALRRSYREPTGEAQPAGEGTGRHLTCRFVVRGHSRLQRCGPGRKDQKLIWVDPFTKGPESAPFKVRQKVYAVVR